MDLAVRRWDEIRARHLLVRAAFAATPEDIDRAVALGLDGSVEALLSGTFFPTAEGEGVPDEPPVDWALLEAARQAAQAARRGAQTERRDAAADFGRLNNQAIRVLQGWWIDRMAKGPDPVREKLTLFWHGHFATSYREVRMSRLMYLQNAFLRTNALGDFHTLLMGISKDPAMILYLDNDTNRKGQPNENFARELFELFSMGIGNYTEADIQEAARAFTGWHLRDESFFFNRNQHDDGVKTILGRTGNFNGDDVVNIVMEMPQTPRFIAHKLLAFYLRDEPPAEQVERWGAVMAARQFHIRAFLGELFRSEEFYAEEAVGTQIKSPVQLVAGSMRALANPPWVSGLAGAEQAAEMGQILFMPPNVAGWEYGPAWISTATIAVRHGFADLLTTVPTGRELLRRAMREQRQTLEVRLDRGRDQNPEALRSRWESLGQEWTEKLRRSLWGSRASGAAGVGTGQASQAEASQRMLFALLGPMAFDESVRAAVQEPLRLAVEEPLGFLNFVMKLPEFQLC